MSSAVGDREQGEALVDVGLGDDVAVDDRRRLDDRRHGRAENLGVLRQVKRLAAVDRRRRPGRRRPAPAPRSATASSKSATAHQRARGIQSESSCHDLEIPLISSPMQVVAVYSGPLNAALAANPFQCQMKAEGASRAECADPLIVALPRQSKLQAVILILDAEAVPDRLPSRRPARAGLRSCRSDR